MVTMVILLNSMPLLLYLSQLLEQEKPLSFSVQSSCLSINRLVFFFKIDSGCVCVSVCALIYKRSY